ncbi:3-keto-5-aminohexanoate cleavage protein [Sulfitobacter sp. SK012]|uniref:bifunctional sugar phosphate isomerase/epimerase/4-hydroxyphenylpyruvate dioxygenase family protein n=1 Tax=Sulfitobacter sp. SK012 TaxID=1389005 RepID=UPI000E0C9036|nr:sugar phosphate isomerase/epimerase and 4-hydroxyphenylpyruvate domain-containing protein [Sulfitobacter sp. SK012]AXI47535.1 3-keto-5-aminohexanoate cleavage protein [Sulfitobacter sp. SK012]
MKTSIATVSISGSLPEKLEAIAAAGYDGIEIFEQDFITHDGSSRDVGNLIRSLGLEITLFQPFRDFEGLPEPLRAKAFDRAEQKFDLMQELGTDLVLICSSCHPAALGGIDRAAEDFQALGERAAKRGLRVGYEALAWGKHVNDHRDAWEIVRRADHENVGIILDSFHTLARKTDPDTVRRIPGDKIFFVQLADAPLIDMDLLYWSRHFRNMPGEGDLQITQFMQAVMAAGYSGPISLEIFNDQFRGGSARAIAKDGYRSLVSLMGDVQQAEPSLHIDMPAIPPRRKVNGVSFIEFATRGDEGTQLEAALASLGFMCSGRHISKALTLWTSGDIRIVINRETTGYASSAYNAHGTTVCDIGLSVDDATMTVARATHLGASLFSQPTGPGELDIPAIRGLSGSVLHFIDNDSGLAEVWDVEFSSTGTAGTGAGLARIDHLAQTMSYDEMLSWSLFYSTLFKMDRSPIVDVIDPDGLVRSQAMETESGTFRMTLNGAESHRTMAGSFLADSFGASVQHIAIATDDIFATCDALTATGFEPLRMPSNYYADLNTRFDLSAIALDKLKARNILYDEDVNGAFFQLYSRPFAGGMFFEIVERRDGYAGYGAPNAPFRIAAQKRLLRPKGLPKV